MMSRKIFWILPVFLVFLLFSSCKQQSTSSTPDLSLYLPASGEIEGWDRERDLLSYMGEDLFSYINGGAEIYHEYGFEQVVVQDYNKTNERCLSVEIYEMTDPAAAYGIYSFKKSPEGFPWDRAHEGRLEGYYLNFWKGLYLVTITGFDEEEETIDGIKSIAETIATKLPAAQDIQKPRLMSLLPQIDLVPGSEKYFKGSLGLFNSYPFSQQDIFNIKEGARGAYTEGYSIYVIQYSDPQESRKRLKGIEEYLARDPRYNNMNSSDTAFSMQDDKETLLYFTLC